ncbi:FAD-dependent monooxygenase [Streptomyces sp. DT2A-34]|uniref:FAD-dependent monooxygenase n=1 Tax=Streptomyces sp. DT2A-34 TaxID=3051182 RepID=UPI00265B7DED|nr:FAD-dependent monooxygenase [Streptomyces sp. DT2A-34]MDO0912453.1 FAD-dependent monooxygenase [Streptomyces sp. DT2A-34]
MRAIVVGAGIGGLAATLSLRRAGVEVTLVEQTARFTEVGAGIQLAPNATRELRRLDVLDAVADQAARPAHVSFRTWSDGSEICRYALGREAEEEFGAPYLVVHRADLHGAMAAAVPRESVRLNTTVVAIGQDDDHAQVMTATGERLTADLVVAADGIRSAARQWLFGKDETVFSGTVAYRALLPAEEVAGLGLPHSPSGSARTTTSSTTGCGAVNYSTWWPCSARASWPRSRGPLGRNPASNCASSPAGTPEC